MTTRQQLPDFAAAARRVEPSPRYDRAEYWADAVVHGVGVALGLAATVSLLAGASAIQPGAEGPLAAYAAGVLAMLVASAVYNLVYGGAIKPWLRRIDHALIFGAIAGTYTPFLLLRLPADTGLYLCLGVWSLAGIGAILKLTAPGRLERVNLVLYLGLGWIGLPVAPDLATILQPAAGWLIVAGGLLYSVGAVIHGLERVRFHNVFWHVLVVAAAGCHYMAMRHEFLIAAP